MKLSNVSVANRIFYTVIALQIIALGYIFFGPRIESLRSFRELVLFLLYFTGVPVVATLLVAVLQKVGPKRPEK